ncbi:YcnI family protein [Streptomyces sp. 71268]|uniref:YcnI family copper-binding membrane protein n=1 Tax=Streptomyces sp. 71268 TaxID=3002640 RepID=UPI0023F91775|nr:YcnI family protein [Streptomyces sp. 71268]WEV26642.1 YcnI family protein [Streptomyces sp. 71268]
MNAMRTSHPAPTAPDAHSTPAPDTAPAATRAARRAGGTGRLLAGAGALAAGAVLLCSVPALAHVSVQPGEAERGGYATINFKVPNERDDASTVKLEVTFPADHPMSSVMPQPVPGWQVKVTKGKLDKPLESHGKKITEAVNKVTWTADGDGVRPGQFQQFPLSVGQLPEKADHLVFKALQTYSNKEVVRWIEEPREGAPEPESPAPVLKLVAADAAATGGATDTKKSATGEDASGQPANTAADDDDSDTTARVLGGVGIAAGIAGVAFGVFAGRRRSA